MAILLQPVTSPLAWTEVRVSLFALGLFTSPLAIVVMLSVVIGLLMILLFGYTSDQKAIGIANTGGLW